MPDRLLTRWLRQGLRYGICPVCRAHHKLDREYIWAFFDQWSMQDTAIQQFAAARGFCSEHAEQLCRIEVQGMRTTIGITDIYIATLQRLLTDLENLRPDVEQKPPETPRSRRRRRSQTPEAKPSALTQEGCPACLYRQSGVAKNITYLLEELAQDDDFRNQLASGSGLCIPHFRAAWDAAQTPEQREQLTRVQHTAAQRLQGELHEHARKQLAEAAAEPAGPEVDSWQRAIWMTAGWPAPRRAASVPEGENPYAAPQEAA